MKQIKLRSVDARVWRQNLAVLLDTEGKFVRHLTSHESRARFDVEKKTRHLRTPCTAEIVVGDAKVVIASTLNAISRETMLVETTIGGHLVMDGREWFKKQILAKHGECQLRSQNGQYMCSVRDPSVARPSVQDAARTAPKPENCQCKGWGQTPGRHHKICTWNVKAPPDEQAINSDGTAYPAQLPAVIVVPEKPSVLDMPVKAPQVMGTKGLVVHALNQPRLPAGTPPAAALPVTAPAAVAVPVAPSPANCVCKEFPAADGFKAGENHHPVCQWKQPWEAQQAPEVLVLVNLETGEIGRQATPEEVSAARSDQGFVLIGDVQFGVVTETEAVQKKESALAPETADEPKAAEAGAAE